jgi:hypothetical protein
LSEDEQQQIGNTDGGTVLVGRGHKCKDKLYLDALNKQWFWL